MANKIVKDSQLSIFVKEVQVATAGTDVASVPKVNDLFVQGNIAGLIGYTPIKGDDGAFYATIDTAAEVRLDNISGAFTNGQTVFRTPGGAFSASATNNFAIGYVSRPKAATAAGSLIVQLVPSAA